MPVNHNGRYRWTLAAFVAAGMLVAGLVVWQLYLLKPSLWCAIVTTAAPEVTNGCFSILLKLLEIKDHAIIGLLIMLGITVLSVVAVALGVKISASGPGDTRVDIGADQTRIDTPDTSVTVPTPPSTGA